MHLTNTRVYQHKGVSYTVSEHAITDTNKIYGIDILKIVELGIDKLVGLRRDGDTIDSVSANITTEATHDKVTISVSIIPN